MQYYLYRDLRRKKRGGRDAEALTHEQKNYKKNGRTE